MAAVDVTISGTLYDKLNRTSQQVVLIGEGSLTGLGVGGGPVQPPAGGGEQPNPPGIWGPNDPRPNPPIAFPPGWVGGVPPGEKPPDPVTPPVKWKPVWTQEHGWVAVGIIDPNLPHPTPSGEPPAPTGQAKK